MTSKIVYKNLGFKVVAVDEEQHIIRGVFSTAGEDRMGEIVDQAGWKLEEYMLNPVVLWGHDYNVPAIGQVIELAKDAVGSLAGAIKFAYDENPLAATIFKLYAGRYLRAFSVGFMNDVVEYDDANDTVTLRQNTLYEISCVNVPANAMALAYAKGIDVSPVERAITRRIEQKETTTERAIEVLSKANIDTLKSAIVSLQSVVEANNAPARSGAVEHPSKGGRANGVPKALINRAVRALLEAKKISTT